MRGKTFTFTLALDAGDAADQPAILPPTRDYPRAAQPNAERAVDFAGNDSLGRKPNWTDTVSQSGFATRCRFPARYPWPYRRPVHAAAASETRTLRRRPNMRQGLGLSIAQKNAAGTILAQSCALPMGQTAPRTETHVGAVQSDLARRRSTPTRGHAARLRGKNTHFVVKPLRE